MNFTNTTVWITGASSGIGEALVHAFAKAGAHIILSARRENELERVKADCMRSFSIREERFFVLPLDLAKADSLTLKAQEALRWRGSVDIMIHNGGISQRSLARETALEVDRRVMEIDYFGTIVLTKALLPSMLQQKRGHFVVISSLVGKFGTPLRSGYSAAKHALHGFFDSLRAEAHNDGISVTIICPGFIKTQVSVNAVTGDGSQQGIMDDAQANGMSADECARRILKAIAAKKLEVYIGGREKIGVYLKRFVPTLFARILRTTKVT
ncbi:MAG: SDR family oxidoreductase [Candidatus Kapabacteria bacterium]|jgi:short-subunit dehydrogenase|nr:SDR family oxidoreductase [Candidatus Kapabacteria bacterium]